MQQHRFVRRLRCSPPSPVLCDLVDQALAEWGIAHPELDYSPFDVISRLRRVAHHVDESVDEVLAEFGLTRAVIKVLATLRRQGPPYRLSQRGLMDHLRLTSATISIRVDQLVELGFVVRGADPSDKRSALVQLTDSGLLAYDTCAPAYVGILDRLLSALDGEERSSLSELLRRLDMSFEGERHPYPANATPLGISLSPAHVARGLQRALGLPECAGLLVRGVERGSPAEAAGVCEGDVLVRAAGREVRSVLALVATVNAASASGGLCLVVQRGLDEHELDIRLMLPPATRR